jgi:hypothetical protein
VKFDPNAANAEIGPSGRRVATAAPKRASDPSVLVARSVAAACVPTSPAWSPAVRACDPVGRTWSLAGACDPVAPAWSLAAGACGPAAPTWSLAAGACDPVGPACSSAAKACGPAAPACSPAAEAYGRISRGSDSDPEIPPTVPPSDASSIGGRSLQVMAALEWSARSSSLLGFGPSVTAP